MSGHSKWANIKHRKEGVDKRRGILFSKLAKELMVATRIGGSDPDTNTRLRMAISRSRMANMSTSTIHRAIKKGAGKLDGANYEEIVYEVFMPGGVALVVECLTDKKSRTTPEIKNILGKYNANLSENNAAMRLFKRHGYVSLSIDTVKETELLNTLVEAGAKEIWQEDGVFSVLSSPKDHANVCLELEKKGWSILESELCLWPIEDSQVTIKNREEAEKILGLVQVLEEHEDVKSVYANFLISPDICSSS